MSLTLAAINSLILKTTNESLLFNILLPFCYLINTPLVELTASRRGLRAEADLTSASAHARVLTIPGDKLEDVAHQEIVLVVEGGHVLDHKGDEEAVGGGGDIGPVHELAVALE